MRSKWFQMKRVGLALVAGLALTTSLVGCAAEGTKQTEASTQTAPAPQAKQEVQVFAAASLTEVLDQIKPLFEEANPGFTFVANLDSSGTLAKLIKEGAPCDVFFSASNKQMKGLDEAGLVEQPIRVVSNTLALAVPKGNPKQVKAISDVTDSRVERVAVGNADVPVGQYTQKYAETLGIWDQLQAKSSFASNVKEVTAWVSEGSVDCGFIYLTDAIAAGLEVVATVDAAELNPPIVYPAAQVKQGKSPEGAKRFLEFLKSPQAEEHFKKAGFLPAVESK